MAATIISSAAGVLALLDEPEEELQVHALKSLDAIVDTFWTEISEYVSKIEAFYDDDKFADRDLAALVTSKVYYHLGELEDALEYALYADKKFDVWARKEYQETIAAKCIDKYIEIKAAQSDAAMAGTELDADAPSMSPLLFGRLEAIVENMFERCFQDKEFKQALGIALESRRLDKMEECVSRADDPKDILRYCYLVSQDLITNGQFRQIVLRKLVEMYAGLPSPDYVNVCQCLMFLDDAEGVAEVLNKLVRGSEHNEALAYQIAFDLVDNEKQAFMARVQALCGGATAEPATAPAADGEAMDADAPAAAATDGAAAATEGAAAATGEGEEFKERLGRLNEIIGGKLPVRLFLEFLYSHNKTDPLIPKKIKTAVHANGRKWRPVEHGGTIIAYAIMQRATHWSRFTATAAIGVINKGHLEDGFNLLSSTGFLPSGTAGPDYAGGGALYALGLTYTNHGTHKTAAHPGDQDTITYLRTQLESAAQRPEEMEVLIHGASLGIGLAALASHDQAIWNQLNQIVEGTDNAVAGEAAGLSMGLVMAGSMNELAMQSMLQYAHDTSHEKIVRGLAIGIALLVYGCEERADTLIKQMTDDKDPHLRYGGMYAIAMAYCGTANNSAMKILLHAAVSDVNDDVRRAAVTALGFVLFRVPSQCPRVVSLLAASYNPHMRYGSAMAVGIACAGTGMQSAMDVLEPLWADPVDFVRQAAFMATAMVLIQHNETQTPKVKKFREHLDKAIGDPHEEILSRFGAILSAGILDAGGRNVTISLRSRAGHHRMSSIIGMAVFTQSWYWYPLVHFLSLSFTPTTMIALNKDLKMPKLEIKSDINPQLFAYTEALTTEKLKKAVKVDKAVLSTAKSKKKGAKEPEGESEPEAAPEPEPEAMDVDEDKDQEKKDLPKYEMIPNPARVTVDQEKYIRWEELRYRMVTPARPSGIIIVTDTKPDEPEEFVKVVAPSMNSANGIDDDEPDAPAPFLFDPSLEESEAAAGASGGSEATPMNTDT